MPWPVRVVLAFLVVFGGWLVLNGALDGYRFARQRMTLPYKPIEEQRAQALWDAEVFLDPKQQQQQKAVQQTQRKIELVVSHCDQPIDWIWSRFAPGTIFDSVTIYSKCGKPVVGIPSEQKQESVTITNLPNVGRCDHTYAHWLAESAKNTPTNSEDDLVFFLKDNNNDYRTEKMWFTNVVKQFNLDQMIPVADDYGFACAEIRWWRIDIKWYYMGPVRMSAYHNRDLLEAFKPMVYQRLKRDKTDSFDAKYDNLGNWFQDMISGVGGEKQKSTVDPDIVPVCYGGNFAFLKSQIASHPPSVYKAIETSLSRGDNIAEGHYAERSWARLLSKPLEATQLATLRQMTSDHTTEWIHDAYVGVLLQRI